MPKYLIQASYTTEGVQGLIREGGSSRRKAVEALVAGVGGRIEACYFAFGDVDVVIIADLPDNVAASALSFAVNSRGAVNLKTTVLLEPEEVDRAVATKVEYRAPGQ